MAYFDEEEVISIGNKKWLGGFIIGIIFEFILAVIIL